MRLLAIDIGTGTQDILLLDTSERVENCVKMVMPSPTLIVARRIEQATARGEDILLNGVTMGGGPNRGALRRHLQTGRKAFATPEAAKTFDDDLEVVKEWGVELVSQDEARRLKGVTRLELKDLDWVGIKVALEAFGVDTRLDGLAVAVLDHGEAPPGQSDRLFRFEHLRRLLEKEPDLATFAFLAEDLPPYLTRMAAVARTWAGETPLVLMDTSAAAALGALFDPEVSRHPFCIIVNLGNNHTMAFHLQGTAILSLFEHHTQALDAARLDSLLLRLGEGSLRHEEVFKEGGHGCLVLKPGLRPSFIAATGPRRGLMAGSSLKPYFAAPWGEMMLTGCFGLVKAFATRLAKFREEIEKALSS